MISAQYYNYIYLFVVVIVSFATFRKYGHYSLNRVNVAATEPILFSIIFCSFIAIFIGTRPISYVFVDMGTYANDWHLWSRGTYEFSWDVENILFDNLRIFMATNNMPIDSFFFLISCIYFGASYVAIRKLFPNDTLFAYLVFLAAFSTFAYSTNGIKAGSAASLFLVALAYHDNKVLTTLFSLLSLGFHHSMIMVVVSYLIVLIYHKPKWYFLFWGFSFIVAALHIGTFQSLFASMVDEQGQGYLNGMGSGFRLDFILYSAAPILIGYYAIFKKKIVSNSYNIILCLYLITNSIWMLCMYAEFTNRIAYLSWFQLPVVLIYPFLKEKWGKNQYQIVKQVAYAHLAFTMYMTFSN